MKKLKFFLIFLCFCLAAAVLSAAPALALSPPPVESRAAVVMDRASGEVYFSQNADMRVYPASVTKVMTVLLAVEAIESGSVSAYDEVTATSNITYDLIPDGSSANITAGETMPLVDLLYCAMLPSANEACNAIAEYIAGDIPAFIARMNERAAELGCTDTHFTNTHGLPDLNHYTTPSDFCRIALEASEHELFMEIADTPSIVLAATNVSAQRALSNSNALINSGSMYGSGYLYEGAHGIKTGYTSDAGYCLISTASRDGIDLLAAVFGGSSYTAADGSAVVTSFKDSITLYDWVFDNYSFQQVLDPNAAIASVDVRLGGDTDYVNLRPASGVTLLLPNDYDPNEIEYVRRVYSVEQGEYVTAPVTAGEVLGEVTVRRNGENVGTVKLVAAASVELSRGQYITSYIRETIQTPAFFWISFAVIAILAAYIAWVIVYRVRRRRYVNAVKENTEKLAREKAAVPAQIAPQTPQIDYFPDAAAPAAPAETMEATTVIPDLAEIEAEFSSAPAPARAADKPPAEPEPPSPAAAPEKKTPFDDFSAETFFDRFRETPPPEPPKSAPEAPSDSFIYKDAGRDYFEEFFRQK